MCGGSRALEEEVVGLKRENNRLVYTTTAETQEAVRYST